MDLVKIIQVPQAESLVPSAGKHIEADLSPDGIRQIVISEPFLQHAHHLRSHVGCLIELFKGIPLFLAAIPSDGRYVQHPIPELHEGSSLDGDVQICDVMKDEVDQRLKLAFSQVGSQALGVQQLSFLVCHQSVLREHVIVILHGACTELFGDLRQVRAAYDAHVHDLA
eukprot:scaffold26_cov397-Pavlova_lutheri.AAC.13